MNWLGRAPLGIRTVWVGYMTSPPSRTLRYWGRAWGQGVLVDHDLDAVPGLFPAGLDVDDGGVTVVEHNEVGTAGQRGGLPAQPEGVLAFDENGAGVGFPLDLLLVEQRRVAHQPCGLVEVGRYPLPVLVVGLEPDGPLAGVLASV